MKIFSLLVLSSLLFTACQVREKTDESPVDEEVFVELSSEGGLVPAQLEASFMSDHQSFSYSFRYDSSLLQVLDTPLEGASKFGASFQVTGGAEIIAMSEWLSDLDIVPELSASQVWGRNQVYRYLVPEGVCTLDRAVIRSAEEGLVIQMRLCPGDDAELGKEAFESLLTGVNLKSL
ncbi:MAG: hypothetical protein WC777_04855 [Candidatus Gracilibacteria bacterium]|jgi:hypothetical protein